MSVWRNGWTESTARTFCQNSFNTDLGVNECQTLTKIDSSSYIESCIADIKVRQFWLQKFSKNSFLISLTCNTSFEYWTCIHLKILPKNLWHNSCTCIRFFFFSLLLFSCQETLHTFRTLWIPSKVLVSRKWRMMKCITSIGQRMVGFSLTLFSLFSVLEIVQEMEIVQTVTLWKERREGNCKSSRGCLWRERQLW